MNKIIIAVFVAAGLAYAQDVEKPKIMAPPPSPVREAETGPIGPGGSPTAVPQASQFVEPDKDEQQSWVALELQRQNLNTQYEMLRISVCWNHGLRPEECGQMGRGGQVTRLAQAAPTPAKTPEKPKGK